MRIFGCDTKGRQHYHTELQTGVGQPITVAFVGLQHTSRRGWKAYTLRPMYVKHSGGPKREWKAVPLDEKHPESWYENFSLEGLLKLLMQEFGGRE